MFVAFADCHASSPQEPSGREASVGGWMISYPSVSLIVVNYKGASKFRDLLLDCVRSLSETNYPNFEIVFVDNASGDGSSELIMENFPLPNLRVERLPANVGYAGAAN